VFPLASVFKCPECGHSFVILLEQKTRTMDATYNFSLGIAEGRESETARPNRLFDRRTLQMISTGVSLVSLFLGFSGFGILIIVHRYQAELHDLSGGSFFATLGGVGAVLLGTVFLVAACLHWRRCGLPVRKSAASEIRPYLSEPQAKAQTT
jgi:hypothetical protein